MARVTNRDKGDERFDTSDAGRWERTGHMRTVRYGDLILDEACLFAVRHGWISVTPLHLDLTHEATRRKLAAQFESA